MSLGSFVQGAFQGYQFGENVKDRKKERARNEERFDWERGDQEWRGEQRDRERENWDYTDTVRGRQQEGWAREDKQRRKTEATQDELDRIRDEGFEDWSAGQGQPVPENTPQGTVRVPLDASGGAGQSTSGSAQATFPGLNVPGVSQPNPNATPFRYGDDVPRMADRPVRVPLGGAGDDTVVGDMGNDMLLTDIQPVKGTYSEEEQQARPQRRETQDTALTPNANNRAAVDYPYNPSSPESRDGRMNPGGARGRPLLADMMDAAPADTQEETGTPEAAPGASVRRQDRVDQPDLAQVEDQDPTFTDERLSRRPGFSDRSPQTEAPAAPAAAQPSTGSRTRAGLAAPAAPQPVGQPGMGAASAAQPPQQQAPETQTAPAPAPQGSGAGQPVYGGMTASQAAQFQDLPEPRMALEDGGQPISIARDSLANNVNADNQGQAPQVTDQQRARAAETFREHYHTQVIPRQIEALYKAGEVEAAEQLQTWLEDKRSQGLQKAYTDAVAAAALGDERGFFDNIGKVYNSFDDGYRFIADESDLYKNDAGETVAKITLENTQTGERFTQEYEGGEELIQQVLTQMDPISVFEQLKGQAEAEAAAAAEQQAWEIGLVRKRIEAGIETGEDRAAVVKDVMTELMKNPGFAQKSPEEQAIEMENWMRLYDMASRGTASPNAPVYLGD